MEAAILRRKTSDGTPVAFALAIDATKVPQVVETSLGYKAIIGGEHPNHLIDVSGKDKDAIKLILEGKDPIIGKIKAASEVKVTVMSFQHSPPGVPPTEIVAALPQSNNESNDFIVSMETAAMAASRSGLARFTNFCVDGVSVEARHVMLAICLFLSEKANHLGSTDPNHNMKSWRYQVVAGGGTEGNTVGKFMLDADHLRLSGVSTDLWRPKDFASDLLVLRLLSAKTIKALDESTDPLGSTSSGDKGLLSLTLFFMRLQLYAVNGKQVPATHRALYLWCSMIFLTSISGASVITKRNVVSETVAFIFLVLCSDMGNPRLATSEPGEHHFGQLRTLIREFTTLEFAQLVEKHIRRLNLMYKNFFRPTRDTRKFGYQATYDDFFKYTVDDSAPMMEGTVKIDPHGDHVATQVWPTVQKLISYSSELMTPLLSTLGVTKDEMSPFCRGFASLKDLRDEFIRYCPRTFVYDDVEGTGDLGEKDKSDSSKESSVDNFTEDMMVERVKLFSRAMLETPSDVDDDEGGGVSVVEQEVLGEDEVDPIATEDDLPSPPVAMGQSDHAELMSHFRSILSVSSPDDLSSNVLLAMSCIEGGKAGAGAVSFARKAKSLVQRWLAKSVDTIAMSTGADLLAANNDIIIERNTILLLSIKIGRGASATNVACHFRVMEVYEKYYNKWFMSTVPVKKWKKEPKPYKVKVRMLKKNAVNEYCDVDLVGDITYGTKDICKIVDDSTIVNVVGKLDQLVL